MTTNFEKKAVIFALLFRFRKKKRKRKLWGHPLISQRLLKGQLHKRYEDLCAYLKNIFHFNNQFLCVKIVVFTTFSRGETRRSR